MKIANNSAGLLAAVDSSHLIKSHNKGWKVILTPGGDNSKTIEISRNRLVKEAIKIFKNDHTLEKEEKEGVAEGI